jgi:proteasome accessory factor A
MDTAMFGVESEYAITGVSGKGTIGRDELVSRLIHAAGRHLVHLRDTGSPSGLFLENGARFYIDCGLHPEMTTPECTTPWEAARYIKAGERILESLARDVETESGASEIMCFRCNVDYSGSGSTWGCHESYLHRKYPANFADQIVPHLVTRVIYTGAGGFNPRVSWPEFCVAPRLLHTEQVISRDSTGNRGIFHTKMESLAADGFHRCHILCGESLCSETAIVLKIGATALVVALAEAGLDPSAGLRFHNPVEALHTVASDITCRRPLRLAGAGQTSALAIQRQFLARTRSNLAALPPWAGEICALWHRTLDLLEGAPDSAAASLDWAIKYRLFHGRAARHGFALDRFPFLGSIVQRMSAALAAVPESGSNTRLSFLAGPQSPIPEEAARARAMLSSQGLTLSHLENFLSMRDEFYQIDTRFGQLGPRGIFGGMDRRGVLDHSATGIVDVEGAMHEPPPVGRARVRSEVIRRLNGDARASCNWQGVLAENGSWLDLSDPFESREVWSDPNVPNPDISAEAGLGDDPSRLHHMLDLMRRRYGRSRTRAEGAPAPPESPR